MKKKKREKESLPLEERGAEPLLVHADCIHLLARVGGRIHHLWNIFKVVIWNLHHTPNVDVVEPISLKSDALIGLSPFRVHYIVRTC